MLILRCLARLLLLDRWSIYRAGPHPVFRRLNLLSWTWEYRGMTDEERKDDQEMWETR